ncbi:hypothetical protein YC2023_106363 [Brassica napus]
MAEPGGPDWTNEWGAPVFMRYEPGSEPEEKCCFLPWIRRREDQGPFLTPEEEERLFEEQVENSQDQGYEIVEVIKANTHPTGTAAHMFYITFRAKELSDDQPKDFQAMFTPLNLLRKKTSRKSDGSCSYADTGGIYCLIMHGGETTESSYVSRLVLGLPFALFVWCVRSSTSAFVVRLGLSKSPSSVVFVIQTLASSASN